MIYHLEVSISARGVIVWTPYFPDDEFWLVRRALSFHVFRLKGIEFRLVYLNNEIGKVQAQYHAVLFLDYSQNCNFSEENQDV